MRPGKPLRIVCLSDTHLLHREVDVPPGEILIHAGDFSFGQVRSPIRDFNDWLGELPHRHKIVIPGNHESRLQADPKLRRSITNAVLLIDESIAVEGLTIWGSPVTPLYGVAFGMSNPADRKKHWARVPEGLDVLVTHGPPYGILDVGTDFDHHQGCPELLEAVQRVKPRLHVFGHVHGAYGVHRTKDTVFVNACLYSSETGDLVERCVVQELIDK